MSTSLADLIREVQQGKNGRPPKRQRLSKKPAKERKKRRSKPTPRDFANFAATSEANTERQADGAGSSLTGSESRWELFARHYVFGINGCQPFNGSLAYRHAYGMEISESVARASAARLLANVSFHQVLARVAREASERHRVDEDTVIDRWQAMLDADIFDFLEVATEGPFAGHWVLKTKGILELPRALQQNLKKLRVRTTVRELPDGTMRIHRQEFELEIIDKVRVLGHIARWLDLFKERARESVENIAELLREAEQRVRRRNGVSGS